MKISTLILRKPFGVSNAELASRTYGGDGWETIKKKFEDEHRRDVAEAVKGVPGHLMAVTSGYRTGVDFVDGQEAEWWSIVIYDGEPL